MPNFTLKPISGSALYVIYALVSYEENRDIQGNLAFEELCSGYHVFAGRDALYFTQSLSDAQAFVSGQLAAFAEQRRIAAEERERKMIERPNHVSL